MTKDRFCAIIGRLKEADDLRNQVDKLFRDSRDNLENDFCNAAALQICHEGVVVELLADIMQDAGDWISYWLYKLDYGRKYTPGSVTENDGQEIDISTPEKLYDFLEREMQNAG